MFDYEFGFDVKKRIQKENLKEKQNLVSFYQNYFNSLVNSEAIKTQSFLENIIKDAGENLSQKDLRSLINKSVKERIKYI